MDFLRKVKHTKHYEAEIARLQQELGIRSASLISATSTARERSRELEALQRESGMKESRYADNVELWRAQIQNLNEEKQKLQDANLTLEKDLCECKAEVEQLHSEVSSRDEKVQGLQRTLARVDLGELAGEGEDAALLDVSRSQRAEVQRLEHLCREKEHNFIACMDKLAQKEKETAKMRDEVVKRDWKLQQAAYEASDLWEVLYHIETSLWDSNRSLDDSQKEKIVAAQEFETTLDDVKKAHQKDLDVAKEETKYLTQSYQNLSNAFCAERHRANEQEGHFKMASAHIGSLTKHIHEQDNQIRTLHRDLHECTEALSTARLKLNQTLNELNNRAREVKTATQERKKRDQKTEFLQQQCVTMHRRLFPPTPESTRESTIVIRPRRIF